MTKESSHDIETAGKLLNFSVPGPVNLFFLAGLATGETISLMKNQEHGGA